MKELFRKFARAISEGAGTPLAFILATLSVILWAATGHHFKYSDSWELIINTSTTIITFLMVFLIQASANRESKVIQLKLNEIIKSIDAARNEMISLEEDNDEVLEKLDKDFHEMHNHVKNFVDKEKKDV